MVSARVGSPSPDCRLVKAAIFDEKKKHELSEREVPRCAGLFR